MPKNTKDFQTRLEGLSPSQRELVLALKANGSVIQQWFEATPTRLAELQRHPAEVLKELGNELHLNFQGTKFTPPPAVVVVNRGLGDRTAPGMSVLRAVWTYAGLNQGQFAAFKASPINVIKLVATSIGASTTDTQAAISAMQIVLGMAEQPSSTTAALRALAPFRGDPLGPTIRSNP